jgi:hypothetical protein
VQDCCAGPPLRIPLLAVMRGTILTPFWHDRSVNIMNHRNLLESVTRAFLARFHSFFHGKFISAYKPFYEFLVLQNLSRVETSRANVHSLLTHFQTYREKLLFI